MKSLNNILFSKKKIIVLTQGHLIYFIDLWWQWAVFKSLSCEWQSSQWKGSHARLRQHNAEGRRSLYLLAKHYRYIDIFKRQWETRLGTKSERNGIDIRTGGAFTRQNPSRPTADLWKGLRMRSVYIKYTPGRREVGWPWLDVCGRQGGSKHRPICKGNVPLPTSQESDTARLIYNIQKHQEHQESCTFLDTWRTKFRSLVFQIQRLLCSQKIQINMYIMKGSVSPLKFRNRNRSPMRVILYAGSLPSPSMKNFFFSCRGWFRRYWSQNIT